MSEKAEEFRRHAERMQAEVQRFVAGDAESTSVQLPDGSAMTVAKVAGPGAGMRFVGPGGALSGRSYPVAAERPADYPAELPFVPDVPVLVQQLGSEGMTVLFWMDVPDPLAVRASIEKQLSRDGWVRGESLEVPMADATVTSYRQGEVERMLLGDGTLMMLMEKRRQRSNGSGDGRSRLLPVRGAPGRGGFMRIAALVCNALLLPFTLLVLVTDGAPTEVPYIVLMMLLLGVPALSLVVLRRKGRAEAPALERATVLANVALLALAWWAVVEQYPHPPDPGVLPYTILVLVTPSLSAWAAWRARKQPAAS